MKRELSDIPQEGQKRPLRVLLVEDSEFDAELLVRYLDSHNLPSIHTRVASQKTMEQELNRQQWDVVLCDYQLPGFGVMPALDILHRRGLDIPFIVVSGAIGEELAVDLMKAGAHDFIVKGRLSRLIPAIERELREAEARHERALSREKLSYLAAIVDSAEEAIIGQTMEGIITTWNSGAERLYGYTEAEAVGQPASIIVPEAQRPPAAALFTRIQGGEIVETFESVRIRKDGVSLDVSLTLSAIRDNTGKIIGASLIAYDVTERKRMEAERTQLIAHLNEMLSKVKTLSGLLPICASCKKIRDDKGYWQQLETFVREHSGAEFSHSICPDCMKRLYPQYAHHIGHSHE
ncbi:MAG TPA: PAS domain S-box protein [Verrucomicrobiae bacterium]|jgi:PAS domain S-box-containing protein